MRYLLLWVLSCIMSRYYQIIMIIYCFIELIILIILILLPEKIGEIK